MSQSDITIYVPIIQLESPIQRSHGLKWRRLVLVFSGLAIAQIVSLLRGETPDICAIPVDRQDYLSSLGALSTNTHSIHPAPHPTATLRDFFPTSASPSGNDAQGDADIWGGSIHVDPGPLHRVYFQNIDGLRNDADEIALYVSSMAKLKTGTLCWADPGLDFSKPIMVLRQSLQRPVNNHFCLARSAFSSSTLPKDGALYGSSIAA